MRLLQAGVTDALHDARRLDDTALLERAAAGRFNRESRHHLLVYLRRWIFVFVAGYALGVLFEHACELYYAAACFYSSSCVSASIIFVILLSWFTLR